MTDSLPTIDARRFRTALRRLVAASLDAIFLSFLLVPVLLAQAVVDDRLLRSALIFFGSYFGLAYSVILHARYGQTLGKKAMRVSVVAEDLRPITGWQAVLRDSPRILASTVAFGIGIPNTALGANSIVQAAGFWALFVAVTLWSALDLGAMLCTHRHRAIHDLIARTIVVRLPPPAPQFAPRDPWQEVGPSGAQATP